MEIPRSIPFSLNSFIIFSERTYPSKIMKRDQQSIIKRHENIMKLLNEQHEVKVDKLAEVFDISLMTARRDLQQLESKGLLIRYHGGARLNSSYVSNEDLKVQKARDAISNYASTLIEDGDSIFINGSMTAAGILEYLKARNVSVVTNNAFAPGYSKLETIQIQLTGGLLRDHIMVGDYCVRNLLDTYRKKAFLGCSGISANGEILCGIPAELGINETMISHAREYFILADSSKLGKTESMGSFTLQNPGTIITDTGADPAIINRLRENGMTVVTIDPQTSRPGKLESEPSPAEK